MPIAASAISRENVSCPSCRAPHETIPNQCPSCGYTAAVACERFAFDAPPLEEVLDVENALGVSGKATVLDAIAGLRKNFPQFRVAICILRLDGETNLREFGHWLINASPMTPGETEVDRRRTLLLILDVATAQASVTLGYDIEPYIEETPARHALEAAAPTMASGDLARGLALFISQINARLGESYERVNRRIKRR